MEWKKVSTELSEFLETALIDFNCHKKIMFGCPAYFVNNKMFAGVHQDNLFIRLPEKDREELFTVYDEISTFEPMEGRRMKEYVILPEPLIMEGDFFNKWLNRSFLFVLSLPEKETKSKKK